MHLDMSSKSLFNHLFKECELGLMFAVADPLVIVAKVYINIVSLAKSVC